MHALTDPIKEVRAAAMTRLTELETALVAHGFSVKVETKFWALTATSRSDRLSPSKSMRLQLAADHQGSLNWYRRSEGADDVELMCPAAAIAEVTERIAHELRAAGQR